MPRCSSYAESHPILASSRTRHWFDPCDLLKPDARSEYRAELRERQAGSSLSTSSSFRHGELT